MGGSMMRMQSMDAFNVLKRLSPIYVLCSLTENTIPELGKMTNTLKASLAHWSELSAAVFVPHTDAEYERLVALLDDLVD